MDTKYPLYTPKDIFISFCGREATEAERWQGVQSGIIFHKRTGNEFLDLFASMVHHYMNHDPVFYAKKLGVSRVDLSGCLRVLTGVTTDEWLEAYRWVAIRDVLLHTDWPFENGLQFGENLQSRLHRACRHTSVPLAGEI